MTKTLFLIYALNLVLTVVDPGMANARVRTEPCLLTVSEVRRATGIPVVKFNRWHGLNMKVETWACVYHLPDDDPAVDDVSLVITNDADWAKIKSRTASFAGLGPGVVWDRTRELWCHKGTIVLDILIQTSAEFRAVAYSKAEPVYAKQLRALAKLAIARLYR